MKIIVNLLLNCIFFIYGILSKSYDEVQIPMNDIQYIISHLQIKYRMNYNDAKNCIIELEHFFTGIKYKIINNMIDHPPGAIKNTWEIYIVHTSMYYNFSYLTFDRYIHYTPLVEDKGQLYIYNKLRIFGIDNMNETVWLLRSLNEQEYYSSLATWNTYFKKSKSLVNFNSNVNKFLKQFIEEYNPSLNNFKVLDIAMGQGRNSIWLAQKGYDVVGFDTSIEGINIAKNQAERLNLTTLQTYVTSIEEFYFGVEQWDLIVCIYFPIINQTKYLQKLEQSLKYKGLFMVEVFHWDNLIGEHRMPIDVTYKTNIIPLLFSNLTTIIYEEPMDYSDFGNRLTKIIRYVGQKQY
uniref:Methyltransferase type 11 n=1 Tax=Adineta vaga TaxID=104782 RepID=G3KGV5_ADIVA|nr:methyltransferase type 11 [Adineta vaga]